jgi:hypothetical protein
MKDKELLKALRCGSVPQKGFDQLFVGNENQTKELMNELQQIQKGKGASVRFLSGPYGAGKTMVTSYLTEKALEMKWATAQVVINPSVRLGNFHEVYRCFCHNLRTQQSGGGSGIINVLDTWSSNQLKIFHKIEGITDNFLNPDEVRRYKTHIENELVSVRNFDPSFSRALSTYASGRVTKNFDLSKYALDWIRASDKIPSRDYSKELGLKGKIDKDDAEKFLKGILLLTLEAGFHGTLFVLDEVETIRTIPNKKERHNAYEILRKIIDDSASGQYRSTLFLITATPDFFQSRQGVKEYKALDERISAPEKTECTNIKQPIIHLYPLEENDLSELAEKIRKIHGETEEWDISHKVPDSILPKLTRYIGRTFTDIKSDPRKFIREIINVFDNLKANPELKIEEMISSLEANNE